MAAGSGTEHENLTIEIGLSVNFAADDHRRRLSRRFDGAAVDVSVFAAVASAASRRDDDAALTDFVADLDLTSATVPASAPARRWLPYRFPALRAGLVL